jgi:hypothetical protein
MTGVSNTTDEESTGSELRNLIKSVDRPEDNELRILVFTATYFVLDGVTLTIRRLESHMRATGAQVKIISTVPEDVDPAQMEHGMSIPYILPLLMAACVLSCSSFSICSS